MNDAFTLSIGLLAVGLFLQYVKYALQGDIHRYLYRFIDVLSGGMIIGAFLLQLTIGFFYAVLKQGF